MSMLERSTPPLEPKLRDGDGEDDDLLTVPDHLVQALMITDPAVIRRIKARRERSPSAHRDEVWEGVYVMSPLADLEHQEIVAELIFVFRVVLNQPGKVKVYPGLNVSDRVADWKANYREPDVAVYLPGNPATFRKAHVCGGPDFAVEILSDNDLARKKLDFYAQVNTRELLLLDRDPWALELYRLQEGRLVLVGTSTVDRPEALASAVLPLTFRLVPGQERPSLEMVPTEGAQTWRI